MEEFGFNIELNVPYNQSLELIAAALKSEGFGVLTKIDVKSTLKEKLDVDFRNFSILGACNPHLAHKALLADPQIGLLLPCNVTLEEIKPDKTLMRIANPETMFNISSIFQNKELEQIARQAREKLERVANLLKS